MIMSKREKTVEKVIRCDEVVCGAVSYSYTLTAAENKNHASFRIPLYSVTVEMTDEDGEVTSASVKDAFCDVGQALIFYGKIVEGLATPIDLAYVYEDEMA